MRRIELLRFSIAFVASRALHGERLVEALLERRSAGMLVRARSQL
jgi:hypothetical protein